MATYQVGERIVVGNKEYVARACEIAGCGAVGRTTRGMREKHYQRWRKRGSPHASLINRGQTGKGCVAPGCATVAKLHGYCRLHWRRVRLYGHPEGRDERHLVRRRWIESHKDYSGDDCLKWPFSVGDHGRGVMNTKGRTQSAPRFMCEAAHGPPPTPKHEAAHSCGRGHEGCMNPRHLRWSTRVENEADKAAHGTLRRGEAVNTARLTAADVREIRARLASESGVSVAAAYGITTSAVSAIRTRKSWAWLD